MHFECEREALLPLLKTAQACTDVKIPQEVARMVRLTVRGTELEVASTNFTLQFRGTCLCDGREDGFVFVPAKDIREWVEGLLVAKGKGATVSFKTGKDDKAMLKHVQTKRHRVIGTADGKAYAPIVWGEEPKPLLTLPGSAFATLLQAVAWCTDGSDNDPERNAVHVIAAQDQIRFEATNYRNKICQAKMPHPAEGFADVALTLSSAHAFAALAGAAGEQLVTFLSSERTAALDTGTARLGCAVLSGIRPSPVASMIDAFAKMATTSEVVVDKQTLESAVLAARGASVNASGFAPLFLVAVPGALHILGEGEAGKAHDAVQTASPVARSFGVPVSCELLLGGLKATAGADVSLSFFTQQGANKSTLPVVFAEKHAWYETTACVSPLNIPLSRDAEAVLGGVEL